MANPPVVAFLPAHPKQLWILHAVAGAMNGRIEPAWILRDKDCTLELADQLGLQYTVISRAATGLAGNAAEMARNLLRSLKLTRQRNIALWITKYGAANIAARLCGRRSIAFNDDDVDVVPLIAWSSYPFANAIIVPGVTRMGRFEDKTLRYPGHQEFFYLHPNRFRPDESIRRELGLSPDQPFALIRLSALQSHHDLRARGMSEKLVTTVLEMARAQTPAIRIFISSEKPLAPELEPLRFPLPAFRIHHALALAEFVVGDSQSMTTEAAVLGTPAFRINSFVNRIAAMEVMERHRLAFGFLPGQEDALLAELGRMLQIPDRHAEFDRRRQAMLKTVVDPLPAFVEAVDRFLEKRPFGDVKARYEARIAGRS